MNGLFHRMPAFVGMTVIAMLTGCASVQDAGRSEYSIAPIEAGGKTICCAVSVVSGREIGHVRAELKQTAAGPEVKFSAQSIKAFEGQAIAADVAAQALDTVRDTLPAVVQQAVRAALGTEALEALPGVLAPLKVPAYPPDP